MQTAATPAGATVDQSDKTIAISGGSWNGYSKFIGGLRDSDGPMNGYTLTLSGVKLCVSADNPSWGAIVGAEGLESGNITHNNLILDNIIAQNDCWMVFGGHSMPDAVAGSGNSEYNNVDIKNSQILGAVSGGCSEKGASCNNIVSVENSEIQAFGGEVMGVSGGSTIAGNATNNTVSLKNAVVGGLVQGGLIYRNEGYSGVIDVVTGNTLNLSGANTVSDLDWNKVLAVIYPGATIDDVPEEMLAWGYGQITNFKTINIKEAKWGTPVLTINGTKGIIANADQSKAAIHGEELTFTNPENVVAGGSMNLVESKTIIDADLAAANPKQTYTINPLSGVILDAALNGSLAFSVDNKAVVYNNISNQASKLTFGDVEWKDSGALINHATTLSNVKFDGADVDTSNINFTNLKALEANKKMTLVSSFGDTVGTITGVKYKVGSILEGEGKASLVGSDLIFTAETGVGMTTQDQIHNTVMGAEAGMAALSAGNDFVGSAVEGLGDSNNAGSDGLATYANMGGGSMKVETGSHVKTRTWNAILALGHKNEKKLSTTEYGAFFEYGTGNYSTFNGDERGDGSTRYTGGGILGKWQKNNGFYVEGSLRAGSIRDDASNVLRDYERNPYSYNTDATYWGAHIGVGKELKVNKTDLLDLYAKYFYNHRGSVSFDAGGHYDLDAVESSVLRIGTRYTVKKNDNFKLYGGIAVEHEFAGRASGTATPVGGTPLSIRGADISGTSVRGEIGATFRPEEKSNVTLDLYFSGFVGKKQGFTGGLSAVFHI
ncbi:MAG: autotransporter outer membrane beta-barrel domain-containing protein [Anaerovibrio sp.]|uniref:autotransporter outer membrane beta-barrel domain-containing protein n=1 Tax=Anaerovibrio sp. TaxID=1872532 RepID=UPI0025C1DED1|nr:autotransporter outer membrane beta-barrel domain-containing protein [Anaerovibrio sp.]MBE6099845.1 autotransporter outer membrane beta-barrel domain-containing protein [Anaerovibrio sp.]